MTPGVMTTPAEAAALQTMLRANGIMRAELGKLLASPLPTSAREFWTEIDTARAIEANALQRLLEAGRTHGRT